MISSQFFTHIFTQGIFLICNVFFIFEGTVPFEEHPRITFSNHARCSQLAL